jgi:hypothetical protein
MTDRHADDVWHWTAGSWDGRGVEWLHAPETRSPTARVIVQTRRRRRLNMTC